MLCLIFSLTFVQLITIKWPSLWIIYKLYNWSESQRHKGQINGHFCSAKYTIQYNIICLYRHCKTMKIRKVAWNEVRNALIWSDWQSGALSWKAGLVSPSSSGHISLDLRTQLVLSLLSVHLHNEVMLCDPSTVYVTHSEF